MRALAGLGLAIASPAGFGIIGVTFRAEPERTIAFSVFGLGNPVGAAVGMVLGGLVAGAGVYVIMKLSIVISRRSRCLGKLGSLPTVRHGWAYLYYILGGVAVIPVVIGIFVIPRDTRDLKTDVDRRIDWLGAGLVTVAVCLFTFSIAQSGVDERGWSAPCK